MDAPVDHSACPRRSAAKSAAPRLPFRLHPGLWTWCNGASPRPAPNRLWVADLAYVSTWSGFAYVAFVVDANARRILGWRVASSTAASMVLDAIEHAIWTR